MKKTSQILWWGLIWLTVTAGPALAQQGANLPPPRLEKAQPPPAAGPTPDAQDQAAQVPQIPPPVVSISARMENTKVPREQTARLVIALTWEEPADKPVAPLDFEFPDPPQAEGLTLFGNSFRSTTELSGATVRVRREYTYEFRADREGGTEIGPVEVKYFRIGSEDKATIKTQPLPLEVIKPPLRMGRTARRPAFIVVLSVLVAAVAAALIWPWLKKRRAPRIEAPIKTVHEIMRERLREIDRLRMSGDCQGYLTALSSELSRYLFEAGALKKRAASASERARAVAEDLGESWRGRIEEFDRVCDQVKFAGRKPLGAEMDACMETVEMLVRRLEERGGVAGGDSGPRAVKDIEEG